MTKRAAILTQAPVGTNYGSTIQTWALQQVLKNMDIDSTTIDRIRENKNPFLKRKLSELKNNILNSVTNNLIITEKVFDQIFSIQYEFVKKHIQITKRIHSDEQLANHFNQENYDIVIVGSDQTWRPAYSPNIYNYFLDFLVNDKDIKKVVYATSFGTDQWEFSKEETLRCSELVKTFDAVSVREKSGIDLCQKHLGITPEFVLDPTMLLKKEDYIKLTTAKKLPRRSGIFSYILDETAEISKIIDDTAQFLKLEHFTNQPKNRTKGKNVTKLEDHIYPELEGWLQAFNDADFIVTNSFHGTVFSILFNKPFISIAHSERGASRFHSLLSLFGLEDRLLTDKSSLKEIATQTIDYNVVNLKLEVLRKRSLDFLTSNLQ
jgi:polysaccharide pyruvyl transferase WcaK-like protein